MADIKSTIKEVMDEKTIVDRTTVFHTTQDALDNFERVVFDDHALLIGDMRIEEDHIRPRGFYKRKILVDLILLIKVSSHSEIEIKMKDIAKQIDVRHPQVDNNINLSRVLSWSEEIKLNEKVKYCIAQLEIWQFLAV